MSARDELIEIIVGYLHPAPDRSRRARHIADAISPELHARIAIEQGGMVKANAPRDQLAEQLAAARAVTRRLLDGWKRGAPNSVWDSTWLHGYPSNPDMEPMTDAERTWLTSIEEATDG